MLRFEDEIRPCLPRLACSSLKSMPEIPIPGAIIISPAKPQKTRGYRFLASLRASVVQSSVASLYCILGWFLPPFSPHKRSSLKSWLHHSALPQVVAPELRHPVLPMAWEQIPLPVVRQNLAELRHREKIPLLGELGLAVVGRKQPRAATVAAPGEAAVHVAARSMDCVEEAAGNRKAVVPLVGLPVVAAAASQPSFQLASLPVAGV